MKFVKGNQSTRAHSFVNMKRRISNSCVCPQNIKTIHFSCWFGWDGCCWLSARAHLAALTAALAGAKSSLSKESGLKVMKLSMENIKELRKDLDRKQDNLSKLMGKKPKNI